MFKFKMQSVLDYRQNIEEKVLNEFSEINRRLEEQKNILKTMIEERQRMVNDLRNLQGSMIRADDIATLMTYIENIRGKENEQQNIIQQVSEELEQKRKDLMEAVKNRKVMEKIREKHQEDYFKSLNELDQKNSDEMSVLKYGRRET